MHFFEGMEFGTVPWLQVPLLVWLLILLALTFDFLNGLHDSANSIATVVSTRVLSPRIAVLWAAFFNFVAFLVFPLNVATTIQGKIVDPEVFKQVSANQLIAATLLGACAWNVLTWYWGLPTSSSHALIGGLIGAALAATNGDVGRLRWEGLGLVLAFIILAPLIGLVIGTAIAVAVMWLFHRWGPRRVDKVFRRGQLLSAALFSLGHGGNDAQKTMGIIWVLLIAASGPASFARPTTVPTEVVLACHLAMGLGTLFGGWRIIKTMGQRIIRLRPVDGFCAETGAALTLGLTIFGGVPVSTTHSGTWKLAPRCPCA